MRVLLFLSFGTMAGKTHFLRTFLSGFICAALFFPFLRASFFLRFADLSLNCCQFHEFSGKGMQLIAIHIIVHEVSALLSGKQTCLTQHLEVLRNGGFR